MARIGYVRSLINRLAKLIGASADMLPTYEGSDQSGRPNIEMVGQQFHYVVAERGTEFERFRAGSVDDLLYLLAGRPEPGMGRPIWS